MATFKPTVEQQKIIEEANRRFDERLRSPEHYSSYFLDKCNSESGIVAPHPQRTHLKQRKVLEVLDNVLGHNNWLVRLMRHH